VRIPLLPEFVDANTAIGQFVVERDRYLDGRGSVGCCSRASSWTAVSRALP
jgi:hypothetical protein